MTWEEVKRNYGQYISGNPIDNETFTKTRLHTFYDNYGQADLILNKISNDIAAVLSLISEGMSPLSGTSKYHVIHEGNLTGKQIKEYLITVVENGGDIWEVLL